VITKIDGEPVRTASELRRRLDRATGEVALTIVRDRREQIVKVVISERDRQAVQRIIR
jgi:S1-C subfamily serine protease